MFYTMEIQNNHNDSYKLVVVDEHQSNYLYNVQLVKCFKCLSRIKTVVTSNVRIFL